MCYGANSETSERQDRDVMQHSRSYRCAQFILHTFRFLECAQLIYIELCMFLTVVRYSIYTRMSMFSSIGIIWPDAGSVSSCKNLIKLKVVEEI
jgi:hypothetical protein